jgi:hypothetical protein
MTKYFRDLFFLMKKFNEYGVSFPIIKSSFARQLISTA